MAFDTDKFVAEKGKTTAKTVGGGGFDADAFVKGKTSGRTISPRRPSPLQTTEGLYDLATQSGLKADADRILKLTEGEKPKEFLSGGLISDIFDGLNALQYGVTGVLKGMSFSEGVRTRQSFSDQDALGDKGIPGIIGGIALDIAVDPLTYIAPATIVKKTPLLSKAVKGTKEAVFGKMAEKTIETAEGVKDFQTLEGGTKTGKWFADKFSYMFGVDPNFRSAYERSIKNIGVGNENIVNLARGLSELDDEVARKILTKDETGRVARVPIDELRKTLTAEDFTVVEGAWKKIDEVGQEAVELGLLGKGKYEENLGEYMKNVYQHYLDQKGSGLFGFKPLGIKGIKGRVEGLTPERMKELGQIENPAYLMFRSAFDLFKDVENAKLFNETAKRFASDVAQEGLKQLPKTDVRLGQLSGKYIPENIFNIIEDIRTPEKYGLGKKLMADFKFNKVVLNPATHARNIMSNIILNWWKLGIGPWRLDKYTEAFNDFRKGGEYWQRAQKQGAGVDTFASQEILNLLDDSALAGFAGKIGKGWASFKKKMGSIYQGEESIAKLTAFIDHVKKGVSDEEAWKAAESATFNYAQVTPSVRKLRTALWGYPFITFAIKSAPLVAETAVKTPQRISVFGKVRNALEQQGNIKETERERASEPPWIKNGFYIKLPIKDKEGRSAYFDLTYILPFGDLVSGQFFEPSISRETGLPESRIVSIASKAPVMNLVKEIIKNQDFYGDRIWNESDPTEKKLGDLMRHLSKTFLPPLVADQIPGGYDEKKGERQQRGFVGAVTPKERADQQRTLVQEMLRQVGAKVQPIDADIRESMQKWDREKALTALLRENGIIRGLDINYVPKR